ncbi:hypothetical protein [Aeromicrobium ginsengisoli]|uniref:Integral membrane protein n=1 Tax=Aeromicrobium ginsengisoli TaxID=363867 RepID=A0A5M4FHI3_9ACTN|nr:hypothetical protein [Aeromicrobium ginsengisoli]KAA1399699.1 hypothetical protein ESP70_002755 [Aeromicrobium ginsengisoli]
MTTNEPPPYPGDSNPPTNDLPAYGSPPPPPGSYPPPQGGYPPPPGGGHYPAPGGYGMPYSAPEAIGYGWRKFKENAGAMILATLIVIAGTIALGALSEVIAPSPSMFTSDGFELELGASVASLIVQTITGTVGYLLYAMLTRGALDVVDGARFDIGRAFGALNVGSVLVAGLLVSLGTTVGTLLCILPGIVFSIFAFFTLFFVVDKKHDPVSSIGASFTLVGRNFGNGLLTGLLALLVLLGGAVLCLVGLLAAFPIAMLAAAYAFRRFQGQPVAP